MVHRENVTRRCAPTSPDGRGEVIRRTLPVSNIQLLVVPENSLVVEGNAALAGEMTAIPATL